MVMCVISLLVEFLLETLTQRKHEHDIISQAHFCRKECTNIECAV